MVFWAIILLLLYLEETPFTLKSDHETLCRILTVADTAGRLARCEPRLLRLELYVVHHAEVWYQATNALSQLKKRGEDTFSLQDKVPVLKAYMAFKTCSAPLVDMNCNFIRRAQTNFTLFTEEVPLIVDKVGNNEAYVPALRKFICQKSMDADSRVAFSSVGQPSSRFNVDADLCP